MPNIICYLGTELKLKIKMILCFQKLTIVLAADKKNQRLYELLIHEKCQSKNVIVA